MNLLQYGASVIVMLMIVAFAAATSWSKGFAELTRKQGWLVIGVPLWVIGKTLGAIAFISRAPVWMAHSLVELWGPGTMASGLDKGDAFLKLYAVRQYHHAEHAA